MVPEAARARVAGPEERLEALAEEFRSYLAACGRPGQVLLEDGEASFHLEGKSAHGMEPDQGINAGLLLIHFLKDYSFQEDAQRFLACTDAYLFEDWRGRALGIASEDEITGPLTINSGIIQYEPEGESFFHINLRFPVCDDDSRILPQIEKSVGKYGFIVEPPIIKKPHHVDRLHPVIQVLQRVYRYATGEEPKLLSTGEAHMPPTFRTASLSDRCSRAKCRLPTSRMSLSGWTISSSPPRCMRGQCMSWLTRICKLRGNR